METKPISDRSRIIIYAVLLVVVTRAFLYATGYLGGNMFVDYTVPPEYVTVSQGGEWEAQQLKLPAMLDQTKLPGVEDMVRFDSKFYLKIATIGYDRFAIDQPHPPADWVFFPLYPLAVAAIAKLPVLSADVAAVIASNLFLIAAIYYLYRLALLRGFTPAQAKLTLLFVLLYPASLYFSVPYTESLFLLLCAATLYYGSDKQYALAFLCAGLSAVTRVPGVINLLFVVLALLIDKGKRWSWRDLRFAGYGLLSLAPLVAYFAYMKHLTGDFLAPLHEQNNWSRATTTPFANYVNYFDYPYFIGSGGWDNGLLSMAMATIVCGVLIAYAATKGRAFWRSPRELLLFVYGALLVVIPFSSSEHALTSVIRYMMVCIPFYLYLVALVWRRELLKLSFLLVFVLLCVITMLGYINNYYFVV